MIASDHQYRVTKDRLAKFEATSTVIGATDSSDIRLRAQLAAVDEQVSRLRAELTEYEDLRDGRTTIIEADTLADLPIALVKARIARGLSQSALAELMGLKPQQIQRWEQELYRSVGIGRLVQVARSLNVRVSERIEIDGTPPVPISEIRRNLRQIGFPVEIIKQRLLPKNLPDDDTTIADEFDARLTMMFGVGSRAIAAGQMVLQPSQLRFSLPASAAQGRTRAYACYVETLCRLIARALPEPSRPLPASWSEARQALFADRIDLQSALTAFWDRGIAVFALQDSIAFHGACWRDDERTVIVLGQSNGQISRWTLDLLHEGYHAAVAPPGERFMIVEADETSPERRDSLEERRAYRFAAEVVTGGKAEELTTEIVQRARGSGPALRNATVHVAKVSGVPVGLLAIILARRLSENNFNWWGVATGLEQSDADMDPWRLVRSALFNRLDFTSLSRVERDFLHQAMEFTDE